jgi:hypothetical protein
LLLGAVVAAAAVGVLQSASAPAAPGVFSLDRLRLGGPAGAENYLFTTGNVIYPEGGVDAGAFYKVVVTDGSGAVRNGAFPCTAAGLFETTDNSYTVKTTDPVSTSVSWRLTLQQFGTSACAGTPAKSAFKAFNVAKLTNWADDTLTTQGSVVGAGGSAFVTVAGMAPSVKDWNTTWLTPSGATACANTSGGDRADADGSGRFPSTVGGYVQYQPLQGTKAAQWNRDNSYEIRPCPAFGPANGGLWQLRLEAGPTVRVDLPAFTVDATPPPAPSIGTAPADPSPSGSGQFTFSDTESGATFRCRIDSGSLAPCTSPYAFAGLADGPHVFQVTAQDGVGNESPPTSYSWRIDTVAPPAPTITAGPPALSTSASASFDFSDTEPGVTFRCELDGGGFGTCTSPKAYAGLAEGAHTFSVRARDGAGNESGSTSRTWTVDTVAPPVPSIDSGPSGTVASSSATFTFSSSEPGVSFRCRLDGAAFASCTSPKGYSGLSEGGHSFEVVAVDAAGNVSGAATRSWTVDLAPAVSLTAPADGAVTGDSTPLFAGTAGTGPDDSPTVTVRVYSGTTATGNPVQTLLASRDGGGAWSVEASPALADGVYTARAEQTDLGGNSSLSAPHTFTVDTVAPAPPSIDSGPSGTVASASASFGFSGEAGATFECELDGGGFASCASPKAYTGLAEGGHMFHVRARDAAGNTSSAASRSWVVDTVAPETAIDSGPSGTVASSSASFEFSSEPGATFQCELDGGGFAACVSPKSYTGLADGPHTFKVRAVDAAGNVDASPAQRSWSADTVLPDTTIVSAPPAVTSSTQATFSFTSDDAGASFQCSLDGAAFSPCASPRAYSGLADGAHQFRVRAVDATGPDPSPAEHHWTVDTAAPPQPSIDAGPSGTVASTAASFEFSSTESGVTFECSLDGGAFAACVSPKGYSGLAQGAHTFAVHARDAAGNVSAAATRSWTVDTNAPETTVDSGPVGTVASTTASFAFSSEPGATFECELDGGGFATCLSPKGYSGLAQGPHVFGVRAHDAAGNVDPTPATRAWTVDTVAPPVPSIDAGPSGTVASTSASFAFSSSEPGAAFRCRLDAGAFVACSSPQGYTGLAQGGHSFQVVAVDAAGNTSGAATRSWTVDVAPVVTLTSPVDGSVTGDVTPSFAGTAGTESDDSSTVTVRVYLGTVASGDPVQTILTARDGGGAWAVDAPSALADGVYTAQAEQTDLGANSGLSNTATFTVSSGDLTPPSVVLSTPADQSAANDPTPHFSGTAGTEAGDEPTVTIKVYAGSVVNDSALVQSQATAVGQGGAYGVDASPALSDGTYTARAEQADAAGNVGRSAAHTFRVDTVPPASTIDSGPSGIEDSADATFTFSSEAGATFECQLDGGAYGACTSPKSYFSLAEGSHTFRVRARDAAGNVDPTPAERTWTVDTVAPPTPTITSAPSNPSASSSATFEFTSSDPAATRRCRLDGAPFATCTSPKGYTGLAEGQHQFEVVAVDAAGNSSGVATHGWRVDTQAPTVTLTMPPNGGTSADSTPLFAGTAGTGVGDAATVTVRIYAGTSVGGTPVQTLTAAVGSGGLFSVEPSTQLTKGVFTANAAQSDTAGNTGVSASTTFTVSSSAYRNEVMADSPRAYYRLAETSGTVAADETGTNPASYVNGVTLGQPGALASSTNLAASFDGVNDYVVAPHSTSLDATTAVTVESWVKRSKSGVWQVLVSKPGNGQSKLENYSIWLNTLDRPVAFFGDGVSFARVDGPVLDTNWHHVAATYDNATARIYVDGTLRASTSSTVHMVTNTLPLNIGRTNGNINFFGGMLDDVAVYGTALSAARIQAHYVAATTFDTTAPAVTLTAPADGLRTANTTPTFSGTAGTAGGDAASVTVRVYSGSTPTGDPIRTLSATIGAGGAYSVTPSAPLAEGTYTARAEQADDAGNVGLSAANTFVITSGDITPPVVTLTAPANGSTTTDRTPAFAGVGGTASGDSATVTVKIYLGSSATGSPAQTLTTTRDAGSGAYAVDAAALDAATYTARAEQADSAGNVGKSAPTTFTIPSDYRTAVMADNPRGYWRLGEGSGSTASDQSGVNNATYNNVTLGVASPLTGDSDTATSFDGLTSYAIAPDTSSLDATSGVTVEAWIKRSKGGVWQCVVSKPGDGASKNENYSIWISPFDRPTAFFGNGSTFVRVEAAASIDTSWHYVVATYNNATARIYSDGVLQASMASTVQLTPNNLPLNFGRINAGGSFYGGQMDEVAVYGTALSEARIDAHFDAANLYDTTAPVVTLSTPDQGTSTKDTTPAFAGMAAITSRDSSTITVNVYSGPTATGTPVRTLSANRFPTGAWGVSPTSALTDGTYTAQASQTDTSGNVGLSPAKTFTILANPPPSSDPVMVGAGDIGDCETSTDDNVGVLLDGFPNAVVYTLGDNAYPNGTLDQFNNCLHPAWGVHAKPRMRPALGGHDLQTPQAAGYMTYFSAQLAPFGPTASDPTKGYYSYDLGSWHVVVLNTECVKDPACSVSQQISWLQADLDAHPVTCTMAIVPNPRWSSGSIHPSNQDIQPFWDVLYEKNVELAVGADEHVYERFGPQNAQGVYDPVRGVREFIAGTGGSSHYTFDVIRANSEVRNDGTFGLLKFTLHNGSYDWEFVPETGFIFTDSGSATCH